MEILFLITNFHLMWGVIIINCASDIDDNEEERYIRDEYQVGENDALYLTPYIERGQIKKAQELASVSPFLKGVESFSGYLTVDQNSSSNMFFWLFKSQLKNWEEQPLVVWTHGAISDPTWPGLFIQSGPYMFTKKLKLKRRKFSWNRKYNLLFIDSPIGTGYSFTKEKAGYPKFDKDVARHTYSALIQIYTLFPFLQRNKLIITGESYGGKRAVILAHMISKMNRISEIKLPLAGLIIISRFVDPAYLITYSTYLYRLGFIDKLSSNILSKIVEEIRAMMRSGRIKDASEEMIKELIPKLKTLIGIGTILNYLDDTTQWQRPYILRFMQESKTRQAIHVGANEFSDGSEVKRDLRFELARSARQYIEEILTAEMFPILFYNGQSDIQGAYALMVNFYLSLQWPRAKDYHIAKRCQFKIGADVAGYYKTAGTFTEVMVRNAGHLVSEAQPKWVYGLIDRFISNSSSFECE